MAQEYNVRAVDRALQVLDLFADGASNFTLTEIARGIELSLSTTLRLLTTLEKRNYIYRSEENHRYYLGFRLAQISNLAFDNMDIIRIARPHLEYLNKLFNESTGLYVRKGDRRICVDRIEGTRNLRSVVQIGSNHILTRGASGRVLLAYLPEERIRLLLESDPYTTEQALEEVRRQGFAVSRAEREPGVLSVAAPAFDARGMAAAAVFVTAPLMRVEGGRVDEIVQKVLEASKKISREMGYSVTLEGNARAKQK